VNSVSSSVEVSRPLNMGRSGRPLANPSRAGIVGEGVADQ
jgi:hypothetical protein